MDAINLALPTNTLANAVLGGGKDTLLDAAAEEVAVDFAALLATGMDQQQALPQTTLAAELTKATPVTPVDDTETTLLLADPAVALTSMVLQLPVPPALATHIAGSAQHLAQLSLAQPESTLARGVDEAGTSASLAADAASIAAAAAEADALSRQAGAASADTELATQAETMANLAAKGTESAAVGEAAARAASLQPAEQRPAPQPTAVLAVSSPVSSPGFADALSHQVVWMVDKDAQVAELRINPPELGPVEVRLTVADGEARAQFVSTHAEVRAAIENAFARLRESLAEAGIQLGQASVSAESFRDQAPEQSDSRQAHSRYMTPGETDGQGTLAPPARVLRGLVDTFA